MGFLDYLKSLLSGRRIAFLTLFAGEPCSSQTLVNQYALDVLREHCVGVGDREGKPHVVIRVLESILERKTVVATLLLAVRPRTRYTARTILNVRTATEPSHVVWPVLLKRPNVRLEALRVKTVAFVEVDDIELDSRMRSCVASLEVVPLAMTLRVGVYSHE